MNATKKACNELKKITSAGTFREFHNMIVSAKKNGIPILIASSPQDIKNSVIIGDHGDFDQFDIKSVRLLKETPNKLDVVKLVEIVE